MGVSCSSVSKDPAIYKFQTLISLMLSSQTKDPVTFATMKKLIDYGLTVENIANSSIEKLTELIYGVSFHNNKAKYIKEVSSFFILVSSNTEGKIQFKPSRNI